MLTLQKGKFYDDGKEVPLEFGNLQQIKLIQEQQKLLDALKGDGLEIDIWVEEIKTYEAKTEFKCISCSKYVQVDSEVDDEDDKSALIGVHACWHCRTKYEISKNKEGDYIAKLVKV